MFVVVHNEDDMEALRAFSLRFKKVFKEVLHQVTERCDDVVCVTRVEKLEHEAFIHCRMLAKSGYNGTKRVCEIINEIFEYSPHEETQVAEMFGNDFTIRISHNTHDLNKKYRRKGYA